MFNRIFSTNRLYGVTGVGEGDEKNNNKTIDSFRTEKVN